MNSLKDTFLWVMFSQPNDSKKLQHRGCQQMLGGALSATGRQLWPQTKGFFQERHPRRESLRGIAEPMIAGHRIRHVWVGQQKDVR